MKKLLTIIALFIATAAAAQQTETHHFNYAEEWINTYGDEVTRIQGGNAFGFYLVDTRNRMVTFYLETVKVYYIEKYYYDDGYMVYHLSDGITIAVDKEIVVTKAKNNKKFWVMHKYYPGEK